MASPQSTSTSPPISQQALGPRKDLVPQLHMKAPQPQMKPTQQQIHAPQAQELELADIHIPATPSTWPPAFGWWILLALMITLLTLMVVKLIRFKKLKGQQQRTLQALERLEEKLQKDNNTQALAEINILLRRLALMRYPRKQIASLTGKDWLDFLDNSGNTQDFSKGAGRILADVPYLEKMPEKVDIKGLRKVVKKWVKHIFVENRKTKVRA